MTELRLRARTVSEIVDAAFALYRRNSSQYMVVAALATVPVALLQLLLGNPTEALNAAPEDFATIGLFGVGYMLLNAVSLISYAVLGGLIIRMGSDAYLGNDIDVANAVRDVMPKVPALLAGGIVKALLLALGVLVFLLGVLYPLARYFAVAPAIVLEGKDPIQALGRSSELSLGRKRHILNTLLLVGLVYLILSFGVAGLIGLTGSHVLAVLVSSAITIVLYPVLQLTVMLLYYDTRIRGEGFDVEQMAAALDAPAATPA